MPAVERVLIVGGGIGGLALAVALADQGIGADVLEINPRVAGVGITLTSSTLAALNAIDLATGCAARGYGFDTTELSDDAGRPLAKSSIHRVAAAASLPGSVGITRPALSEFLTEAARARGVRIRDGVTVRHLAQREGGVEVSLTDASVESYPLVVGADGSASDVRRLVFANAPDLSYAGQGVWRFLTERHPAIDHLHVFVGPRRKAGFIPLSERWMYLFTTVGSADKPRFDERRSHEFLSAEIADFTAPIVMEVRDRLTSPEHVIWRPFETLLLPAPWYRGRVVLIGDAAHSLTPHITAGGGMAIEDAVVLASLLGTVSTVEQALKEFMARRLHRVRSVYEASLAISRLEQSEPVDAALHRQLTQRGHAVAAEPF